MSAAAAQLCLLLCRCIRNLLARMLEACEGDPRTEAFVQNTSTKLAELERYLNRKVR